MIGSICLLSGLFGGLWIAADHGVLWGVFGFILMLTGTFLALELLFWITAILLTFTIRKKEYDTYSRFYHWFFAFILDNCVFVARGKVQLLGMDRLPKDETFLFVSNHISNFDTFVQGAALRKYPLAFVSKVENFRIFGANKYMRRCRYLGLDREDPRQGTMVIRKAADMIRNGEMSVGIYPEGTRNADVENLMEFKGGSFKIALWAKCPLVVGVIDGTENIRKNFPFRKTDIVFEIIRVIPYEEFSHMKTEELATYVSALITEHRN